MTPAPRTRSAFSLVELLTVIAIIALLVALLLPAVQAARESSRRVTCSNNLKQLALGCLQYDASQGHFPSGGWGFQWTGDPDAGLGQTQPGGWSYQILPFIERNDLFDMGTDGVAPRTEPNFNAAATATQNQAARDRGGVGVALFTCPTRRGVGGQPCPNRASLNMAPISVSGGIDYAGSAGNASPVATFSGANAGSNGFPLLAELTTGATGVIFPCSRVSAAHISDGLSVTFLLGEYNRHPDDYGTALPSIYGGGSLVVSLSALAQDTPGLGTTGGFGAAHAVSCFFAFCDGAVRPVRYDIPVQLRNQLANRKDRAPANLEDL
jgi:prepilin-type N-terminal cleavage/methylation domain-containing protein